MSSESSAVSFKYDMQDCPEDIVENARWIVVSLGDVDKDAFEASELTRDGIERCIERACEAVIRLGDRGEVLMPGQPWGQIRGMGNRLCHAYHQIAVDTVWDTVRFELPSLATAASAASGRLEASLKADPIIKVEDQKT